MNILLRSLRLPYTTGTLKGTTDLSDIVPTRTDYAISEIYYRTKQGQLGGERLGVQHVLYIPANKIASGIEIKRGDNIEMSIIEGETNTYEVVDIMFKTQSNFEDHYKLEVSERNKDEN